MSEPILTPPAIETAPVDSATELETIKKTLAEIVAKRQKDKTRLAALEVQAIALQDKAAKAEAALQDLRINAPLRRMANTVSEVPDLFMAELAKHYSVTADNDGNIAVVTLDGKPAIDPNGKPVEFTPHSLYALLASQAVVAGGTKDARSKTFAVLMKYFGASGAAGATSKQGSKRTAETPVHQFGFR